jgi:5-methylthioadenosine/S-adenosylhomocysteine deaminase
VVLKNIAAAVTLHPTSSADPFGVYENVDIHVAGSTIGAIRGGIPSGSEDTIDCTGLIAIPGLVNAHHHLYQSFLRGVGAWGTLDGWFEARRSLLTACTPRDRYHAIRLGLLEAADSGVTTVCEFASNIPSEGFLEATMDALEGSPIRVLAAVSPPAGDVEAVIRAADRAPGPDHISVGLIPAAVPPPAHNRQAVRELAETVSFGRRNGLRLFTHILEQRSDRELEQFAVLRQAELLGTDVVLAHAVHPANDEVELLAQTNTAVVYNPVSNARLGTGIMPLGALLGAGVCVGLGTDGSCNDAGDMFECMKFGMGMQRAAHQSPQACTPFDALALATLWGARTLGIADRTGTLEVGKSADIVLVDPCTPNFAVINDVGSQVVLNATPRNVRHVLARGQFVKRGGRVRCYDAKQVVEEAARSARELRERSRHA